MSNPLIRDCEHYVVIEPCKAEEFLTAEDTLEWLETWLKAMDELPDDIKNETSHKASAQRLIDTACALEIKPGFQVQWFAVRLTPSDL